MVASVETLRRDWQRPQRLDELATAAGVSMPHYSALFRRHTGFAPIDFLIRLRVQHACRLLDATRLSVVEVAEHVRYPDPDLLCALFSSGDGLRAARLSQGAKRVTPIVKLFHPLDFDHDVAFPG